MIRSTSRCIAPHLPCFRYWASGLCLAAGSSRRMNALAPTRSSSCNTSCGRGVTGSDPAVIGRKLYLANQPHTIIGVMPARTSSSSTGRWMRSHRCTFDCRTTNPRADFADFARWHDSRTVSRSNRRRREPTRFLPASRGITPSPIKIGRSRLSRWPRMPLPSCAPRWDFCSPPSPVFCSSHVRMLPICCCSGVSEEQGTRRANGGWRQPCAAHTPDACRRLVAWHRWRRCGPCNRVWHRPVVSEYGARPHNAWKVPRPGCRAAHRSRCHRLYDRCHARHHHDRGDDSCLESIESRRERCAER